MIKKLLFDKKFNIIYSLFAVIVMWAVWMIAAAAVNNELIIAPFAPSAGEFFALFAKTFFWQALSNTLLRTLIALALSFFTALALACLSALFPPFEAFMRPIAALLRSLPTMAVLLLIKVRFLPQTSPVVVAMLVLFPMIYSQLYEGISGVDGELLGMAKVYKLTFAQKLKYIYLPHIAPSALENTGVNLSFALKLIVSAEVMALTRTAIGGMMSEASAYYNFPRLAALTLVAVLFGIAVELLFRALSFALFKWRRSGND